MDSTKTFNHVVEELLKPNEVTILGITGQAGAGKSNYITPLAETVAKSHGFPCACLGLDAFFILSSRARREWIAEGAMVSADEKARRENQITWWDFDQAQQALLLLKCGDTLHLSGVYNRADTGELTGTVHIAPPEKGMLLIFEGVAIAHLRYLDELMYVHAPSAVRFERLFERDVTRRKSREEAEARFALTQAFELGYFPNQWKNITCFIDNSTQSPQVLPQIRHEVALI